MWKNWIVTALGTWLFVSAFVPSLVSPVNFAAAGLVMLALGLLSMHRRAARMAEQPGT